VSIYIEIVASLAALPDLNLIQIDGLAGGNYRETCIVLVALGMFM